MPLLPALEWVIHDVTSLLNLAIIIASLPVGVKSKFKINKLYFNHIKVLSTPVTLLLHPGTLGEAE